MMIFITLLFIFITLILVMPACFPKKNQQTEKNTVPIDPAYRQAYLEQKAELERQRDAKMITPEVFDEELALISRDFLAQTQKNTIVIKKSMASFLFVLIVLLITTAYYWGFIYTETLKNQFIAKETTESSVNEQAITKGIRSIDQAQSQLAPIIDQWLTTIKQEKLEYNESLADLKPPKELETHYLEIIQILQRKLAKGGLQDKEGLELLGTLYFSAQVYDMAQKIYEALNKLNPDDPQILLTLAQLEIATHNNTMTSQARLYFSNAIKLSPNNDSMVMMYAVNLSNTGLYKESLEQWIWLADRYDPNSEIHTLIQRAISGLQERIEAAKVARTIEISINVDDNLSKTLPAEAVLFVFAKASEEPNTAPLFVKRLPITQFPMKVELTDQDKMTPEVKNLQDFDSLFLTAKISLNGNATSQENDVSSKTITLNKEQNQITLDIHESI